MGEVRVISAVESAKVKGGNELPKPPALIVVQWIGYIWAGYGVLMMLWMIVKNLSMISGDFDGDAFAEMFFDGTLLLIAETMFLIPFLAMCFCMKRSRYFVPLFCTMGVMVAFNVDSMPAIINIMGFVPSVAIWVIPSIRKWYDSLI